MKIRNENPWYEFYFRCGVENLAFNSENSNSLLTLDSWGAWWMFGTWRVRGLIIVLGICLLSDQLKEKTLNLNKAEREGFYPNSVIYSMWNVTCESATFVVLPKGHKCVCRYGMRSCAYCICKRCLCIPHRPHCPAQGHGELESQMETPK